MKKGILAVLCIVILFWSYAIAASKDFTFLFHQGEGRMVNYTGGVEKENTYSYMNEITDILEGTQGQMIMYAYIASQPNTPVTSLTNPAAAGTSKNVNYTRQPVLHSHVGLAGYTDSRQYGKVVGTFRP